MALIWGKEFRFLYNDPYAEIIQDKHPSALGCTSIEIFPEIWQTLEPLFSRVMNGEAIVVNDFEFRITRRGTTKPSYFSFSYTPIVEENGVIDGFLAVVVETTTSVVREQERTKVFDTVLSAINDFAYTFDREGRFVYVNKALLDLWGLRLEEAVGKNFFDLNYPDDLAHRLQNQIKQVIAERKTVRDETRYVSPSGVEGFYEYIFSPVIDPDGSVLVVAGSTRDITSRKKLELAAAAAARAKDNFLATLSHELRTPLNPVLLLATEASKNEELPFSVRADFKTIADNVAMEARLIDDLLDISRITHDKLPLDLKTHDLHSLILRATESVGAEVKAKELSLKIHLEARSLMVVGDEVRLQQIFWNLFRNAAKFTSRGGQIDLRTRISSENDKRVLVEISDSGIGMTAEELNKVFEPFAQGEHFSSGNSQFGGLGLGLAISRKLVELHSGKISARSLGRNHGSTFVVELPLEPTGTSRQPWQSPAKPVDKRTSITSARILLVEDHELSRQVLARLLTNRKISVVQASSAHEALEMAKVHVFDLVISDIGLPDQSGYALMAELKKSYGCRGIALSGYGSEGDIARGKEAGFLCHLTKPVQSNALDEVLDQFL